MMVDFHPYGLGASFSMATNKQFMHSAADLVFSKYRTVSASLQVHLLTTRSTAELVVYCS